MSFFEWMGEGYNPGRVGTVDVGGEYRGQQPWPLVGFRLLFSLAAIGGAWYLVFQYFPLTRQVIGITLLSTMAYVALGWLVRPKADMSNVGMFGGLVDQPFRYSDDMNRSLLFFQAVLFPGKFIGDAFADAFTLVLNAPSPSSRPAPVDDEFSTPAAGDPADPFAAYYQDGSAPTRGSGQPIQDQALDEFGSPPDESRGQSSVLMIVVFVAVAGLVFAGLLAVLLATA